MLRVALVRGKYLNLFEGQNFTFKKKDNVNIVGVSSLLPLHQRFPFRTVKLFSPIDVLDYRFPRFIANRTSGDIQILFGLEKLRTSFDIFHTADSHYYFSYQLAKLRQKKLIKILLSTSWETIPFNNESTRAKKTIKKFTMNQVDQFICPTERAKNALIIEGVSKSRITIIPLGVDLLQFRPGKKQKKRKLTILFVGRLVEEKGLLDLISAYQSIQKLPVKIQIVGKGPLKNKIKQNKNISVLSNRYENIQIIYQNADIMVIPSKTTRTWEEQYGMVVVEAMASGLPIIAYKSGALKEVLSSAAYLVREGDIDGLRKAITTLVNNNQLRNRLGTIARRRAEMYFDCEKTKKKYKNLYETFYRNSYQKRRKNN